MTRSSPSSARGSPHSDQLDTLTHAVEMALAELTSLHQKCRVVEEIVGRMSEALDTVDSSDAQRMDEVTQLVAGVRDYLRLAQEHAAESAFLDRETVLMAIKPFDLAGRLSGSPAETCAPDVEELSGDVDLF